jgi:diguanylate cyclase (GGDEF)-like protein
MSSQLKRVPAIRAVKVSGRLYIFLIALQFLLSTGSLSVSLALHRIKLESSVKHDRLHRQAGGPTENQEISSADPSRLLEIQNSDEENWRTVVRTLRIESAKIWFDGLALVLMIGASVSLFRLRSLMQAQNSEKDAAEAALRAERATLEERIENRTAELRAEVEERRRAEQLNRGRNRVLEMLARNHPTDEIISLLTRTVAEQRSSWGCALHLVSKSRSELQLSAAADLPERLITHLAAINSAFPDAPESAALGKGSVHAVANLNLVRRPWSELLNANGIQSVWSAPFFSADGTPLGTLTIYSRLKFAPEERDLEELEMAAKMAALVLEHRRIHSELVNSAYHDYLTGLPNRRLGEERLKYAIFQAGDEQRSFAILWIDLNRFKRINDVHGHSVGDAVLQQVASCLSERLQPGDTLARMGGDEFMTILNHVPDHGTAESVASLLAKTVTHSVAIDAVNLDISVSIGISVYPVDGTTIDVLQRNADRAMYEAKWNGLDYCSFVHKMSEKVEERHELEEALILALKREEFRVHYHAQCAPDGKLLAFEALLRFEHPQFGKVPPSLFVPIIEELDLIMPLGNWVIRQVCIQSRRWQDAGYPPVPIAVNISPLQFSNEDFAENVSQILRETGHEPRLLELELTENLLMKNFRESARQMRRLKNLGVRIAMDDFGTGYSSLSHLHRLPIDVLKIDRSFIEKLTGTGTTRPIVEAVLSMAHKLGLWVVAEGVETEEQMHMLREAGCNSIQGYLFAKPAPANEAERMFKSLTEMGWPLPGAGEQILGMKNVDRPQPPMLS